MALIRISREWEMADQKVCVPGGSATTMASCILEGSGHA